ncbi:MAG: DUF4071 domain-containing protein [SAR324 cluster bacterium]|nr:DUF4071 domain-containing protein [SAR324 cluster bacterium]
MGKLNEVDDIQSQITGLIEKGQFFQACEMARTALERYPNHIWFKLLMARTLILTGATNQAREILEPLLPTDECKDSRSGEETAGLLGRAYKDLWHRTGNPVWATRAREAYTLGYQITAGLWPGINASTMAFLTGEPDEARRMATELVQTCQTLLESHKNDPLYWIYATMGEACLILGERDKALQAYHNAVDHADGVASRIVSSRRQLFLLRKEGILVPDILFNILTPATVIQFTGHMLDRPGRKAPRFPAELEAQVTRKIQSFLDGFHSVIGYCSAACGSDILFAEAMLARGWEVNIMLPFAIEDFIQTSVAYAGADWVTRFRSVLDRAASIRFLTEEPFLGDEILFNFAGKLFHGFANLRADSLVVKPHLLTVWDGVKTTFVGGTADIINGWSKQDHVHVIRIDELLTSHKPITTQSDSVMVESNRPESLKTTEDDQLCRRIIKTLLFADIVGYSKLREQDTPQFIFKFLEKIANDLKRLEEQPSFLNTWGDAIFAVMDTAESLAHYATALNESVCNTDWSVYGMPTTMNIRIALHVGPVFKGWDPLIGRTNYYGAHVNRVARIEAVTAPGLIYVSEQFAALLSVEQEGSEKFICDYVGQTELAKNFGSHVIYSLRRVKNRMNV